ncbi:MAG TPA: hypothetical protein VKN99_21185 [Polyangia bacterium]|nr:hypothetical protein [Polyangia bacterium]
MALTDFDPAPIRAVAPTFLAVVRPTSHELAEERLTAALRDPALAARSASFDEVTAHLRRFGGVVVLAEDALAAAPLLARMRSTPEGVLLPVLVWVHKTGEQRLLDPEWLAYADAAIDNRSAQPEIVAGLERLRRIAAVRQAFPPLCDQASPSVRRRLALLQYLASRELSRLDPRRAACRPLGHSFAPLDLLGGEGPIADLDALAATGHLRTTFFERVHVCSICGDARLAFREVCAGCRSADLRHGEVLHHYACGHVAPEERFRRAGTLACPSCGAALRHVGIDHERPVALVYCNACGLAGGEGITLARCLACAASFSAGEVESRVLASYQLTPDGLAAARQGSIVLAPGLP